MADQASEQPTDYDQRHQNIHGSQTNVAGDQHIHLPPSPPVYSSYLTPQPAVIPFRSMVIALCVSAIITILGHFFGILVDVWPLALSFSLSAGLSLTIHNARILRQEAQQRKEKQRSDWCTSSIPELTSLLRQQRRHLLRLIKDSDDSIPLTKQQREQWLELMDDIDLLKFLITDQGGTPPPAEYDQIHPPTPPQWSRRFLWIKAHLSYLLSVFLITAAAFVGTTVPRATAKLVIVLIEQLPLPSPTLTPEPTMTTSPDMTPTLTTAPTLPPTATPTTTPTSLPTATVTPTVVSILVPTATIPPTIATAIAPPPLSTTITNTLTLVPRTGLQSPRLTPSEVTATSTTTATYTPVPTDTPTVEIGTLTGHIAYPVLNGNHYDTVVRNIATNRVILHISRARQPDLSSGGYLLVNKEGGGFVRVDLSRSDERQITERDEDARPHWAAAENGVVFESFELDKNATILKLQVSAELQSNPPYLPSPMGGPIRGRNAIFLEDGRIAFNACASWNAVTNGECGIWLINTNGSGISRLSDQAHDYPTDNLKSQVLFTSNRNDNWDVYITEAATEARRLTDDPAHDGLATASPTGTHIAFVSDRSGHWAVWVMNADGTEQRKLFDLDGTFGTGDRDWTNEKISWGP